MKPALPLLAGLAGLLMKEKAHVPVIPSHKIEQKKEAEQLSKRGLQRMKGKGARKNRGNNRHKEMRKYGR